MDRLEGQQERYDRGGLIEDNTTNKAAWRNKIISYTGDPRFRDKPGTEKKSSQSSSSSSSSSSVT